MFEKRITVRRFLTYGHLAGTVPEGADLKLTRRLLNDNGLSVALKVGPTGGTGAVLWR
jgi:hypothetical protein